MVQYNHIVAISQQEIYKKMKLEEDLKAVRYIRECIDLTVSDEGFVMLPAWQFALFVREYESHRRTNIMWIAMFALLAVWFMIYSIMLR
jgi:hypothetical protein